MLISHQESSMLINEVRFNNRIIELCSEHLDESSNVFTIIIGRNGCGKSTLLQKICQIIITSTLSKSNTHHRLQDLIEYNERRYLGVFNETGSLFFRESNKSHQIDIQKQIYLPANIDLSQIPESLHQSIIENIKNQHINRQGLIIRHLVNDKVEALGETLPKIIAVSSSPFDKFPLLDERTISFSAGSLRNHYIYRGARTKDNSTKGYMRSKFDQLGASFINFFLKPEKKTKELLPLFAYLGLKTKFTVKLKFADHFSFDDILSEQRRGPLEAVRSVRFFKGKGYDDDLTDEDKQRILSSAKTLYEGLYSNSYNHTSHWPSEEAFSIELDINDSSAIERKYLEEFSVLVGYDLVDLDNIEFIKVHEDRKFLLTEASSGELCILFNVLAIAGSITDKSIILLDEPELSLHPEWQKDFLPLIKNVFSHYKKCHFILATHSPNIVSSIPLHNSFVVNLENNPAKALDGNEFSLKSSDYQLAKTFNSPGYKNEYLISQLVDVLSQLSEGKKLDECFIQKIKDLIEFEPLVIEGDPVKKLLSTLKKAFEVLKSE